MRPMDEPTIAEQAARWVTMADRGGDTQRAALAAWLQASPQHVKEFLLASALDRETDELDLSGFDVESLLAGGTRNVVELDATRIEAHRAPPVPRWPLGAGLAAVMLAAVGGWWMLLGPGSWQSYATAVGEQRTFELDDGSVVDLDPASRIEVRLTEERRDLRLVEGEALFKVERDAARPFRVTSGGTVVRVVGTQFAVHRRSGSVTVSVLEGRVEVNDERLLNAGDEIKVLAKGAVQVRTASRNEQSAARRSRSLTFSGDTLAEIAADFNRYNRTPQIRIEGTRLLAQQYSGVFDADDPQSLADYLMNVAGLSVRHAGDTLVISD